MFPADQVDIHLLRCQQLRLYILKAARALLSHQDKLRQILSQPAVVDIGPNPSGKRFCVCSVHFKVVEFETLYSVFYCLFVFCVSEAHMFYFNETEK